uniref:Methionine synthase reductase n=1 Tax=Lepeophtheirus salmonis TaxID=72036 RepID=A0A0K2U4Z1_LEPSM
MRAMDDLLKGFNDLTLESDLKKTSSSLSNLDLNIPSCPKSNLKVQLVSNKYASSLELDRGKDPSLLQVPLIKFRPLNREGALKRTLEITLGALPDFLPGDAISIICPNPEEEVNLLMARLDVDGNMECKISAISKKKPEYLPSDGVSVKELLMKVLDIRNPPKKQLLRLFAEYASNETEKRRLQELCSKQGANEYLSFIREPGVSPLDILLTFSSISIPFEILLEHLPRLTPRAYSIASSYLSSKTCFDIVFTVVDIPVGKGRVFSRKGLCTGWFEDHVLPNKSPGSLLYISSRPNNKFHLKNDTCPIIMVGPGTGVAPFRGFLQHLNLSKDERKSILLFGCRNRNLDYIYREELEGFGEQGTLTHLWTSFSRESSEDNVKYVQDNIRLHQKEILSLLFQEDGVFYVCGDARNMAKDVNEVLTSCIAQSLDISEMEAKKKVMDLMVDKKYLVDVW